MKKEHIVYLETGIVIKADKILNEDSEEFHQLAEKELKKMVEEGNYHFIIDEVMEEY